MRCYLEKRASAAVEFALVGLAFIAFLLAIVNLGMFGLTLSALQQAVEKTARKAAVTAANGVSSCPTEAAVQTYFNNYAAPVIPANGATLSYGSYASGSFATLASTRVYPWVDSGTTGSPPGTYIALTAQYNWKPIGFIQFSGFTMRISSVAFAMGSPSCPTS